MAGWWCSGRKCYRWNDRFERSIQSAGDAPRASDRVNNSGFRRRPDEISDGAVDGLAVKEAEAEWYEWPNRELPRYRVPRCPERVVVCDDIDSGPLNDPEQTNDLFVIGACSAKNSPVVTGLFLLVQA